MTTPDGPIAQAALDALAAEEQAQAEREQAERDSLAQQARDVLAGLLPAVDPTVLDADVHAEARLVLLSDGDTTVAVDREQRVRLAELVDGQPTAVSDALESAADLGRALRGRA